MPIHKGADFISLILFFVQWHNSNNNCWVDAAIILEAHGIITDMLLEHSILPAHIVAGLQALATLLTPPPPNFHYPSPRSRPFLTPQSDTESDNEDIPFPDSGEKIPSSKKSLALGKKYPGNLPRRLSTSTWTTTTSATGMPTLEPHPNTRHRKSISFRPGTVIGDDGSFSRGATYPDLPNNDLTSYDNSEASPVRKKCSPVKHVAELEQPAISGHDEVPNDNIIVAKDGIKFELPSVISDPFLSRLDEWDFPIFDLNDAAPYQLLTNMSYKIFHDMGLFETFRIPIQEFINYFHCLEMGYREKPYHNRLHSADVLHGVYYLTSRPIPGFQMIHIDPSHQSKDGLVSRDWMKVAEEYGVMGANFPPLELMAMFTAAAMHDYDHPGRTNAFLVTTHASQAILYNDRSVLENHHAAAAWTLLLGNNDCNFIKNLDKAEFKRFRFLCIEAILATDLKRHFEILAEFNTKVNESAGINWHSETDRLLISEIVVKLADINGPCKIFDIHFQWTKRIASEFYEQGDEEESLGLPISPYMDRRNPQLARLQESFINHLVGPLTKACACAGLLPGFWEDTEEEGGDNNTSESYEPEPESEHSEEDDEEGEDEGGSTESENGKKRSIFCILQKHLQDNHNHWVSIIKQEEAKEHSCTNLSISTEDFMDIIEEENSTPRSLNQSFSFEREDSKL